MVRRDWILVPVLSLLTIYLILVSMNMIAQWTFPSLVGAGENCIVFNDPSTGARGIPNTVCREKIPEGEITEYRFNSCGHRTDIACGPKTSDAYRIVMIGGSYAMGMRVPKEKTFATLLPAELSLETGRHIELYNEGMPWRPPNIVALHFDKVLAAKPNLILWIIVPSDIWSPSLPLPEPELPQNQSAFSNMQLSLVAAMQPTIHELSSQSEILFRHFLYESQSQTIASYLAEKSDEPYMRKIHGPEFLRTEPSDEWRRHLTEFDGDVLETVAKASAVGVPLVAVLLPERAQAAMISSGEWPAGFDPYKLDNELRSMFMLHGGTYIDILPSFRNIPNTERGFFPIDGHPNARGHAMISGLLDKELTGGALAVLRVAARRNAGLEPGR